MKALFLSAGVPSADSRFAGTADPFLINLAVRTLVATALGHFRLVWGGHPAITPMIWAVCQDLNISYSDTVTLYQSAYFENILPEEAARFRNMVIVPSVDNDRDRSLARLRREMLGSRDIAAGVFVGGMDGILEEYRLFTALHPKSPALVLGATGGASRTLAESLNDSEALSSVDFVGLFYSRLQIPPPRL